MKVVKWLVAVLALFGIASYTFIHSKHPQRDGELHLSGLSAPVEVVYDSYGIPHITAENDKDMYLAFGYIHAQDRLFQMDLLRRIGRGKMAEWFGKEALKMDRLFRTIQVEKHTSKWMENYIKTAPAPIVESLHAYLSGINQFIDNGPVPIEYALIGADTEHFTTNDMAAVLGFTAFSFTVGMSQDAMITSLADSLTKAHIEDLGVRWQPGSTLNPVAQSQSDRLTAYLHDVIEQLNPAGIFQGSNGWVLAPSKTKTGKAMLMNDPHMGFAQPSVWYEAHLKSNESEIYGHHLALVPFAFLGHNPDVAWGLTMLLNDDVDLFREKLNPDNPNQYWATDHWAEFTVETEVIKVKGEADVVLNINYSRNGPIVNGAYTEFEDDKNPFNEQEQPLAMWWLFYHPDNNLIAPLYELARAKTPAQAAEAVSKIYSPGLNVMYADKHDNIAWWGAAKLIHRPEHVNSSMILDGASGKDAPIGFHDFSKNPQILNPERGFLLTANNQPADTGIGLIPGYYLARDRAKRIEDILLSRDDWDVEAMKVMLMDNTSTSVPHVQHKALSVIDRNRLNETELYYLDLLLAWEANHELELIEPSVYNHFQKQLYIDTFADEMGEHKFHLFLTGFLRQKTLWKILDSNDSPWWDNVATDDVENMSDTVTLAWQNTISKLSRLYDLDPEKMKWRHVMKVIHRHPFAVNEQMSKVFSVGPLETPGGNETINNMIFKLDTEPFTSTHGPSTRRIVDFSDLSNSWGINPTGQSGIVTDKHYDDQAIMYVKGQFRRQIITPEQLNANQASRLTILPE